MKETKKKKYDTHMHTRTSKQIKAKACPYSDGIWLGLTVSYNNSLIYEWADESDTDYGLNVTGGNSNWYNGVWPWDPQLPNVTTVQNQQKRCVIMKNWDGNYVNAYFWMDVSCSAVFHCFVCGFSDPNLLHSFVFFFCTYIFFMMFSNPFGFVFLVLFFCLIKLVRKTNTHTHTREHTHTRTHTYTHTKRKR